MNDKYMENQIELANSIMQRCINENYQISQNDLIFLRMVEKKFKPSLIDKIFQITNKLNLFGGNENE